MSEPKLTNAQRLGLDAVRAGTVSRVYRRDGNVFRTPAGIGPAVMRKLASLRLICDGPANGVVEIIAQVRLTDAGRKLLWHEESTS